MEAWKLQYSAPEFAAASRFKLLVLEGDSRFGKTRFACSSFGVEHTYVCNCQAVKQPFLARLDMRQHKALVMDEPSAELVEKGKAVFASRRGWLRALPTTHAEIREVVLCVQDAHDHLHKRLGERGDHIHRRFVAEVDQGELGARARDGPPLRVSLSFDLGVFASPGVGCVPLAHAAISLRRRDVCNAPVCDARAEPHLRPRVVLVARAKRMRPAPESHVAGCSRVVWSHTCEIGVAAQSGP